MRSTPFLLAALPFLNQVSALPKQLQPAPAAVPAPAPAPVGTPPNSSPPPITTPADQAQEIEVKGPIYVGAGLIPNDPPPITGPPIVVAADQICALRDPGCACTNNNGLETTLCGYVDSNWQTISLPNQPDSNTAAPANPSVPGNTLASQTEFFSLNPMLSGLLDLNLTISLPGAETVIRNLQHPDTKGQYLQGLKGIFNNPAEVLGVAFATGDRWQFRWDFAWYDQNGNPPNKPLGPHFEILAQTAAGTQISRAYYPLNSSPYITAQHPGDFYKSALLIPMGKSAIFDPVQQNFAGGLVSVKNAAGKLASMWLGQLSDFNSEDMDTIRGSQTPIPSQLSIGFNTGVGHVGNSAVNSAFNNTQEDPSVGAEEGVPSVSPKPKPDPAPAAAPKPSSPPPAPKDTKPPPPAAAPKDPKPSPPTPPPTDTKKTTTSKGSKPTHKP